MSLASPTTHAYSGYLHGKSPPTFDLNLGLGDGEGISFTILVATLAYVFKMRTCSLHSATMSPPPPCDDILSVTSVVDTGKMNSFSINILMNT
ncbi:hypothetical protein RJT34_30983 [Clitoria ternatea]|uniref:Uncharacterized protein n=1 Tax=Clitoria ternatea TaxID=43366 RepID=A0AAN9I359_CLITE